MNTIICDKCKAEFTEKDIKIKTGILEKDEQGYSVDITYFECPKCKAKYTVLIADRQLRLLIQKLRFLNDDIRKSPGSRKKHEERKNITEQINKRKYKLKEKYKELIELSWQQKEKDR